MDNLELAKNLFFEGKQHFQDKNYPDAEVKFRRSLELVPDRLSTLVNLSATLVKLEKYDASREYSRRAIALDRQAAQAWLNLGLAEQMSHDYAAAAACFDTLVRLTPDAADAHFNRGIALHSLKRFDEAAASHDLATRLDPAFAGAWLARGDALHVLERLDEALESYDTALGIRPDHAVAHFLRGNVLGLLKRPTEALDSYDRAIELKPDYVDAYYTRGHALKELERWKEALDSYECALKLDPGHDFLYGAWLHLKSKLCEWDDMPRHARELERRIDNGDNASLPFAAIALTGSPALQRKAAELWVNARFPGNSALGPIPKRPRAEKIRIGYFSADFRTHAVAMLTAGLFELHDRSRFAVYAFSYGGGEGDPMRARLGAAFDEFIDVQGKSSLEIAGISRRMGIDIAIDLGGSTADSRTGVFAARAAPVQVNFIGYPGTVGSPYIDYIIADQCVIPESLSGFYTEKAAYLHCFQPNDRKREISEKRFTRGELGLPENGFVFCCFNNSYKITPGVFDGWMRILGKVPDSVLLLLADNEWSARNLRDEAMRRGVEPGRLFFGGWLPPADNLARYRIADLFLDTTPFNAGTTASDALWAGLPVLTLTGDAFASRMAASLLNAIRLPELIAGSQADYESLAIELASNAGRLTEIKDRLARNRLTTALFDTALFTGQIEEAYTRMYERHQADLPPDHIYLSS